MSENDTTHLNERRCPDCGRLLFKSNHAPGMVVEAACPFCTHQATQAAKLTHRPKMGPVTKTFEFV